MLLRSPLFALIVAMMFGTSACGDPAGDQMGDGSRAFVGGTEMSCEEFEAMPDDTLVSSDDDVSQCATARPVVSTTPPPPIECHPSYREAVTEQLDEGPVLRVEADGETKEANFADLDLRILHSNDGYEGRALAVTVSASGTEHVVARHLYQLARDGNPPNSLGGQGFTGLVYVYHPLSGAELQFICRST